MEQQSKRPKKPGKYLLVKINPLTGELEGKPVDSLKRRPIPLNLDSISGVLVETAPEHSERQKAKHPKKHRTLKRRPPPLVLFEKEIQKQPSKSPSEKIEIKLNPQIETSLKTQPTKLSMTTTNPQRLNEKLIAVLEEFAELMIRKGEPMRARAYQVAAERLMLFPDDIVSIQQLKDAPAELKAGIGKTILAKFDELMETGEIKALLKERSNPTIALTKVYGIGPSKAAELIEKGITSVEQLKTNPEAKALLNEKQLAGLAYFDDIEKRIPRAEIERFQTILDPIFKEATGPDSEMRIVGSYRRGAQSSGDIDIIITNRKNDKNIFWTFLNKLRETGIIKVFLTEGKTKSLTIAQLPGQPARRLDFMYTSPDEYAFAILYFTGSKYFNVAMREFALSKGYSLNEHGLYIMNGKVKGTRVEGDFPTEESIFKFLGMAYKDPAERKGVRSVEIAKPKASRGKPPALKLADEGVNVKVSRGKPPPLVLSGPKTKTLKVRQPSPEKNIRAFKEKGVSVLKSLTEKELEAMVQFADEKYHADGSKPVMTDGQYDIMRECLQGRCPDNPAVKAVGASVKKNKVTLPYPMPSMDKIKPDTGALDPWKAIYTGPYIVSGKADGVSGLYSTENGERKLYTRGNGSEGGDISHLIPYLKLPTTPDITIRGEFMIKKELFNEKYSAEYANARNFIAGLVNREKNIDYSVVRDVQFVAYEVMKPVLKPSAQMEFLEAENVDVIIHQKDADVTNESLSDLLVEWRQQYAYDIDGIIVVDDKLYPRKSGNPEHAFAFKMVLSDQVAEAKVTDVIWAATKHGYLKPRIQIEPVVLGGTTITYATAFNAAFVEENKLGIGAVVQLVRSGDVIPHIMAVITPAEKAKMPDVPYKWNESHVDVMVLDPKTDKAVQTQNIVAFFKELGVDGLGPGNVQRIIDAGYNTVAEIIHMTKQELLNVQGFKEKTAEKIHTNIEKTLEEASLAAIMAASHIFGRGMGEKRIQAILDEFPTIVTSNESDAEKTAKVLTVSGMARKTTETFVSKLPEIRAFLKTSGLENKLNDEPDDSIDKTNPWYKKNVVLSGTRDKEVIAFLKSQGANITGSVNAKTSLLITKDAFYSSSNVSKAEELNIPVITASKFKEAMIK